MNTKVRPWVSWTDFVLIAAALSLFYAWQWGCYQDGLTGGTLGFLILFLLPIIPIFGLVLLIRPWVDRPRDRRLHQLWIRPLLIVTSFLALWAIQRFSPYSDPEVTPCLRGQYVSVLNLSTPENIATLRQLAADKLKAQKDPNDFLTIREEELPRFLKNGHWNLPRPITLDPHKTGIEMDVYWGGTLFGWFGLSIDPQQQPKEGVFESPDGAFRFYRKITENVYFYHSNG
jgi:hypothetical protein